jgi:hypothetical protein
MNEHPGLQRTLTEDTEKFVKYVCCSIGGLFVHNVASAYVVLFIYLRFILRRWFFFIIIITWHRMVG